VIALTFDDGPDPEWTPRVLDALGGAPATFFPLSPRAAAYPELMQRIRDEGHLIGLHGWAHLKHPESTRAAVEADTDRALTALPDAQWWRLPYGRAAPWSAELAEQRGLRIAGWTHDTHDWRGDSAEAMAFAPAPGEVLLMHDALGPGVRRPDCRETVALVERLLESGLEPVRLDALETIPAGRPG
jgi:peptidoglycan/xylan/chitin deacetylase (PgdA/CDA1 family)